MPSKYENMTMQELKKMCRQKNILGYSKLNKLDLIKLYKKNSKGKKVNQNKTKLHYKKKIMKGGFEFDDRTIHDAVDLWCLDSVEVERIYGHISDWDVSDVTNMSRLFLNEQNFNENISNWDVSSVTNMESMFKGASAFNQPIGNWTVSSVTNMCGMFENASVFNQHIGNWNVSSVTNMSDMFERASAFNQPIGNWTVSSVTSMSNMFNNASAFNQPIGNWDVSSVTSMNWMFANAREFNQSIENWTVSSGTRKLGMFHNSGMIQIPNWTRPIQITRRANAFNQNIGNWNRPSSTGFEDRFRNASAFRQHIGTWDVSSVTNTSPSRNIIIKKNMLKSKNNTCNTKLYDFILGLDLDNSQNIKFKFEGQAGIDAGGLSRTVFDLFYKTYINKFFTLSTSEENILNIQSSNDEKIAKLNNATDKLIILAKNADVKIYMHINDVLLKLLISFNPIDLINLNIKNMYNKNKTLNNNTRKIAINKTSTISNVIVNNNKKWEKNFSNIKNENINEKKEVYLRRYLKQIGFTSYKQFEIMQDWIKTYWNNNIFTNKLSFSKEDFIKRIKLIKGANEHNLTNTILNNNSNNSLVKKYPNLKVLLEYIKMDDDIYRQKFCAWATGSIYSNASIMITLNDSESDNKPFIVHTCFNRIDVYQTNPNPFFDIEKLEVQISSNSTSFSIA